MQARVLQHLCQVDHILFHLARLCSRLKVLAFGLGRLSLARNPVRDHRWTAVNSSCDGSSNFPECGYSSAGCPKDHTSKWESHPRSKPTIDAKSRQSSMLKRSDISFACAFCRTCTLHACRMPHAATACCLRRIVRFVPNEVTSELLGFFGFALRSPLWQLSCRCSDRRFRGLRI